MATPERDPLYSTDGNRYASDANRTVYTRESNGTGWFVGIIVALALLAIGYLVFSANSGPATTVDVNTTPAIEAPVNDPLAPAPAVDPAPMTQAPAVDAAPAETAPAVTPGGAETAPAPAADPAAPATPGV